VKNKKNKSFWQKLKEFFFPKDFIGEVKKGIEIGTGIRIKAKEKIKR
jgi:hypothetical protein